MKDSDYEKLNKQFIKAIKDGSLGYLDQLEELIPKIEESADSDIFDEVDALEMLEDISKLRQTLADANAEASAKIESVKKFNEKLTELLPGLYKMLATRIYKFQQSSNPLDEIQAASSMLKEITKQIHFFNEWSDEVFRKNPQVEAHEKMGEWFAHSSRVKALNWLVTPYKITHGNKFIRVLGDAQGKPIRTAPGTWDRAVMDKEGNLYVFPEQGASPFKDRDFHLDANILVAGRVIVENGKVRKFQVTKNQYVEPQALAKFYYILDNRGMRSEDFSDEISIDKNRQINNNYYDIKVKDAYLILQKSKPKFPNYGNPKNFIDALRDTNTYLRKRAHESNWLLSKFGEYTGADYFKRQEFFTTLLKTMEEVPKGEQGTKVIIDLIRNNLESFKDGKRSEFADNLKKIASALEKNEHALSSSIAQEVIKANSAIHQQQQTHKENIEKKSDATHKSKADYAFTRNKLKNKIQDLRKDFANETEMDKMVQHNLKR